MKVAKDMSSLLEAMSSFQKEDSCDYEMGPLLILEMKKVKAH